jgi:hypothetical protein
MRIGPTHVTRGATAALAVAAVLGMTSCTTARTVRFPGSVIRLRLDEYRILPSRISVRPGRIKIVATDTGVLVHNVRILAPNSESTRNPVSLGGTDPAHPGQTVSAKVVLPPGRYRLACTLLNHVDLGQTGTLIVR